MKKWKNEKGFTLAELLIVVAIIAILVAISIPVFNSQLEKSRETSDVANLRAAKAEATVAMIDNENPVDGTEITAATAFWYDASSGKLVAATAQPTTKAGKGTQAAGGNNGAGTILWTDGYDYEYKTETVASGNNVAVVIDPTTEKSVQVGFASAISGSTVTWVTAAAAGGTP